MFRVSETDVGDILNKRITDLQEELWMLKSVSHTGKNMKASLRRGDCTKLVDLTLDPQYALLIEWESSPTGIKVQAYRYWPRYGYYYVRGEAAGTI